MLERHVLLEMRSIWLCSRVMGRLFHMWQHTLKIVFIVLKVALQVVLEIMVIVRLVLKGSLVAMHVRFLRLHLSLLSLVVRGHDGCQALGQLCGELKLLCTNRGAGLVLMGCGVVLGAMLVLTIVVLIRHQLVIQFLLVGMIVGAARAAIDGRGRISLLHHSILRLASVPLLIHYAQIRWEKLDEYL